MNLLSSPCENSVAPTGLSVAICSAPPWKVRVTVRGDHAGDYEHPTYEAARQMADERNKKFGILGCHYRLLPPANECPACGKAGVYVRTRYFASENADVWECTTPGCSNYGMIFHTQVPLSPNKEIA